jgi:hypothetical protein
MLVSSLTANYDAISKHWRLMVRKGTRKPVGPAASKDKIAQLPIEPATSDQKYFDALIDRITDENRHEAVETGPSVGRELW